MNADRGADLHGIPGCPVCLLPGTVRGIDADTCPRCRSRVRPRRGQTLQQTWALVITAAVLLVPANVYPIIESTRLGRTQTDTILSGVQALLERGLYGIALIVFIASVAIPLLKLLALAALCLCVQFSLPIDRRQLQTLHRIVLFIGRWSMLDLFVIAVLVSLVQAGQVASVSSGPAATAFVLVVILTMVASRQFDSRLLWLEEDTANDSR